jgi:hypothetical protein
LNGFATEYAENANLSTFQISPLISRVETTGERRALTHRLVAFLVIVASACRATDHEAGSPEFQQPRRSL